MPSELERRLRALFRAPRAGQREHQQAHESAVMAAFSRKQGRGGAAVDRSPRLPRLALAALLGAGAAVGACALPSEYPVDLGRSIEISVDADRMSELDAEALARYIERELGAERVEIHMMRTVDERQGPDGQMIVEEQVHLRLFALGGDVDTEEGWEDLLEAFPILADAEVAKVPLEGTVHGTLGGRLSMQFLDLTIDEHGVEEAERQILEQLRAGGVDTSKAKVDVFHWKGDDGHEEIRVRVEAEHDELQHPGQ